MVGFALIFSAFTFVAVEQFAAFRRKMDGPAALESSLADAVSAAAAALESALSAAAAAAATADSLAHSRAVGRRIVPIVPGDDRVSGGDGAEVDMESQAKAAAAAGGGLHSSTSQLNLSRFDTKITQDTQLIPLKVLTSSR